MVLLQIGTKVPVELVKDLYEERLRRGQARGTLHSTEIGDKEIEKLVQLLRIENDGDPYK